LGINEIRNQTPDEIERTIRRMVSDSENPYLTGVCCINTDDSVEDENIETIFKSVEDIKSDLSVG
jgi:hypothetical protein